MPNTWAQRLHMRAPVLIVGGSIQFQHSTNPRVVLENVDMKQHDKEKEVHLGLRICHLWCLKPAAFCFIKAKLKLD